jgi:hypothetical protein
MASLVRHCMRDMFKNMLFRGVSQRFRLYTLDKQKIKAHAHKRSCCTHFPSCSRTELFSFYLFPTGPLHFVVHIGKKSNSSLTFPFNFCWLIVSITAVDETLAKRSASGRKFAPSTSLPTERTCARACSLLNYRCWERLIEACTCVLAKAFPLCRFYLSHSASNIIMIT